MTHEHGCTESGLEDLLMWRSGDAGASLRDRVGAHLEECAVCRAALAEIAVGCDSYAEVPLPALEPERYARMLRRATLISPALPAWHWKIAALVVLAFGGGVVATMLLLPRDGTPLPLAASLRQGTPHERLRAAVTSAVEAAPPQELLAALLDALRSDPSTNVRLAVLDALRGRPLTPGQGQLLVAAFADQTHPLLRKSLIELYVAQNVREAVPLLRAVLDGDVDASVRDRARWALEALS